MTVDEALQEIIDAVLGMSHVNDSYAWDKAGAQERLIQAVQDGKKALEPIPLRVTGEVRCMPTRSHHNDAGLDLYVNEQLSLAAGQFADVQLGIAIEFPPGWWGRIVGRSSTFRQLGCLVIEGIIDEGYRGDLYVGVRNLNFDRTVILNRGDRIAQLLLHRTPPEVDVVQVEELSMSARGANGFGSTGR